MKRRNIFTSNNDYTLPSLSQSGGSAGRIDGSGRGVHMDAPIVRSWKNASGYTRASYIWMFGSILCVVFSFRYIMYHYATTFLECEGSNCTLKIIPPTRSKPLYLSFHKDQMITVEHVSVNLNGDYDPIANQHGNRHKNYRNHHGSHHSKSISKENEIYDSYGLILAQDGKDMYDLYDIESKIREQEESLLRDAKEEEELTNEMLREGLITKEMKQLMESYGSAAATDPELMKKFEEQKKALLKQRTAKRIKEIKEKSNGDRLDDDNDDDENNGITKGDSKLLESLKLSYKEKENALEERRKTYGDYPRLDELYEWAEVVHEGQYMVVMRKYNIGHRRRRITSLMKSVMNFIEGRRERIVIRENRNVAWQGILGLVLGMFSFLLSLLVGQFWEPVEKKSYRSPKGAYANSVRRKHVDHITAQGPPRVPKSFPSSATRMRQQGVGRPKAYGGYVPGKSTY